MKVHNVIIVTKPKQEEVARVGAQLIEWFQARSVHASADPETAGKADLAVVVGGDGTLLQASHFMDDSIPVVGVNSDPTQVEEVLAFFNFAHTLHPSLFSSQLLLAISPKSPFSK